MPRRMVQRFCKVYFLFGHPAYGLLILLRGRSDAASCSSHASLRVGAGYAAADIQTAVARTTALSNDPAERKRCLPCCGTRFAKFNFALEKLTVTGDFNDRQQSHWGEKLPGN